MEGGAKRHLHRGFGVRLAILEEAILELEEKVGNSERPLSSYLSTSLTALLNSYYLHSCGALDNLAWTVTYLVQPSELIDETKPAVQRLANLAGRPLRKALRESAGGDLATQLKGVSLWYNDLRALRDPAAHRTPLFVPPAVLSKADVERYRQIDVGAAELIRSGRHADGMAHLRSQDQLGTHYPIFVVENPEIRLFNLPNRVGRDHEKLLKTSESVLRWISERVRESA